MNIEKHIRNDRKNYVFSVILPTFNRPDMLFRSVASIHNQTFRNFELIIINDGSTVDYCAALSKIINTYKDINIKIIHNKKNQGAAAARNTGIKNAEGSLISFLDDDDEYLDTFLTSTYNAFQNTDNKFGFSWCGVKYINYQAEPIPFNEIVREFKTIYLDETKLFEELLSLGIGHGFTIRKKCLKVIGTFTESLKTVEDTDIFFRLLKANYIPIVVPGIHIKIHNHNLNDRLTDPKMHALRIQECKFLFNKHYDFLKAYPSLKNQLLNQINFLEIELKGSIKNV
jgi:glycosyltransferase involved in cell wall biosynthesis